MTPTETLLKELEELESKATPWPWQLEYESCECDFACSHKPFAASIDKLEDSCMMNCTEETWKLIASSRNALPALLQIIRTQREELERMAKVDVSLLSNELAAAWALRGEVL